jgi:hypothetical protein
MHIQVHAGDGGADAEKFAAELGKAFAKSVDGKVGRDGRVVTVEGPGRL